MFLHVAISALCLAAHADCPKPAEKRPYVEFDFSTLVEDGGEGKCTWTIIVKMSDKDLDFETDIKGPRKFDRESTCAALGINMRYNDLDAEVVDKIKLRVYGRKYDGKFYPATKGKVESKDLKPEELPKVKNPTKEG